MESQLIESPVTQDSFPFYISLPGREQLPCGCGRPSGCCAGWPGGSLIAVGHWQVLAGRATKWPAPGLHVCFSPDMKDSRVITQHLKTPQNALYLPFPPAFQASRARLPTTNYKEQKRRFLNLNPPMTQVQQLRDASDIKTVPSEFFRSKAAGLSQQPYFLPLQKAPVRFEEITCLLNDWANSKAAFQGFQRTHNQPGETESLA